jgi:uncharacterized membrane protein YedE/YeeE
MNFGEWLSQPWPWYISGPLIGLMVPALLLAGNKSFGVSSNFRHICAACFPANISYFKYDWKKETWNLFFVAGVAGGSFIAYYWLNSGPMIIDERLSAELQSYGISNTDKPHPTEIFNWPTLLSVKGFLLMVVGGFLIGFGTRYAGGCTSGHSITGISNLQLPSFVATCCFMIGGLICSNFILPHILKLP